MLNDLTKKDFYYLPRSTSLSMSSLVPRGFQPLILEVPTGRRKCLKMTARRQPSQQGYGFWKYYVMAFGLCNASATFEHLTDTILGDLRLLIYLLKHNVHAMKCDLEFRHLRLVFCRLRAANLNLRNVNSFDGKLSFLVMYSLRKELP